MIRIDTMIEDDRWDMARLRALAERCVPVVMDRLGMGAGYWEVSILGCDDKRIGQLNADFRGKPSATNVLSWPSEDRAAEADGGAPVAPEPRDPSLGDIAIAYDTCRTEADAAGIPMADHVTHLLVHGTLHLLGYDHIRDGDAALMEQIEVEILGKLGISDPYCR